MPILGSAIGCSGSEETLLQCLNRPTEIGLCYQYHYYDVGVECVGKHYLNTEVYTYFVQVNIDVLFVTAPCQSGDVRLAGSSDPLQGRVEVCVNETWGTICEDFWDTNDTSVVCRQLGFSAEGIAQLQHMQYSVADLGYGLGGPLPPFPQHTLMFSVARSTQNHTVIVQK